MNGFFYLMQLPAELAKGLGKCSQLTMGEYVRKHRPRAWLQQGNRVYFPRLGKRVFTAGALVFADSCAAATMADIAREYGRPLFADKGLQESYSFYEPVLLCPAGLDQLIKLYQSLIVMQYMDVLMPVTKRKTAEKQKKFFKARAAAWAFGRVLNLDPAEPMITEDGDWEHEIFDLLRVRQMDWEKNGLSCTRNRSQLWTEKIIFIPSHGRMQQRFVRCNGRSCWPLSRQNGQRPISKG